MAISKRGLRRIWTFVQDATGGIPVAEQAGDTWYDNVADLAYLWTGTVWTSLPLTAQGPGVAGFIAGGNNGTVDISSIDEYSYPNETVQALVSTLSSPTSAGAAASSFTDGYILGGNNQKSSVEKFNFSAKTATALGAILPPGVHGNAGSQSDTHGYSFGGWSIGAPTSAIQMLRFSDDSVLTHAGTLSVSRYYLTAVESGDAAYACAGTNGGALNTVDKVEFAGDAASAVSTTSGTLTPGHPYTGFSSNVAGYIANYSTNAEKMLFSAETWALTGASMTRSWALEGSYSSRIKGYSAGHYSPASIFILSLTFATDTSITEAATLTTALHKAQSFSQLA